MSRRGHRPKARELYAQSDSLFGEKVTFEKAFPEIATVRIEVNERGHVGPGYGYERGHSYSEKTVGEYADCSNPLCYGGGFNIGSHLREMVREHKTEHEFMEMCDGYEGSVGGKRRYRNA